MLQVLTNSSICFGTSVICVSRSLQWMTLTPSSMARWLKLRVEMNPSSASAFLPLALRSPIIVFAMSISPCLVKCEIRPGLAPCSTTAVGPLPSHLENMRRSFMCRQ